MSDWEIDPPSKDDPPRAGSGKTRAVSGGPASPSGPADDSPPPADGQSADGQSAHGQSAHGRRGVPYLWVGVAVVMLLVGLLGGYFIAVSQTSGEAAALAEKDARLGELQAALAQSQDRNWSYYRANKTLKTQLEQATSGTSTTTSSTGPKGVFSDGVYIVGEDIPAGTYDGVVNGTFGYWARLKGREGSIAQIVENGLPRGPFVLTVTPADDAVELRGVTLTLR